MNKIIRDALILARDYINDGSLLPQDMNHPYFKTSDAIDAAITELDRIESEKPGEELSGLAEEAEGNIFMMIAHAKLNGTHCILRNYLQVFAERYHQSRMKSDGECEQYDSCLEKFIEHWNKKSRMEEKKEV